MSSVQPSIIATQLLSSVFASALKLNAVESVHPNILFTKVVQKYKLSIDSVSLIWYPCEYSKLPIALKFQSGR